MRTEAARQSAEAVLDKRRLQAVGVLLPIRLEAFTFLPGRHPLGRAGVGMRFLRSRPFEPGEDNPRDIDKFSPPGEYWVNEWESEAQASIRAFGDLSGSMAFAPKAAVRNLALLQLTYSLWRANDRVRTVLYNSDFREECEERSLRTQLQKLTHSLCGNPWASGLDAINALDSPCSSGNRDDLIFLISDFLSVSDSEGGFPLQRWRSMLQRRQCDVVPVIVSFELHREVRGAVKLRDPGRGSQQLVVLSPPRIDRINDRESRRVNGLEKFFRKLSLDYLTLRGERDVYPQLARLARARRRRVS